MIDKSRPAARKAGTLPAFTPVPRHYQRFDGWTPERQTAFIEALADLGSVRAAAHAVNMTPEGAYHLRRHADAASFRKAWEAALALGVQRLEDHAMDRALHGHEVPVYSYGKIIGSRTVHNDRLLMFLLRHRAPARFAADGRALVRRGGLGDPADATRLSRLKKQWRKEWEEEKRKQDQYDSDEVLAEIDAQIDRMRHNRLAAMTPATRALQDAYMAAQAADDEAGRNAYTEMAGEDEDEAEDEEVPSAYLSLSDYREKSQ